MNNSDQNKILKKISSLELNRTPFDYCVIDDFFPSDLAKKLADEFLDYNDESWFSYENKLEHKILHFGYCHSRDDYVNLLNFA